MSSSYRRQSLCNDRTRIPIRPDSSISTIDEGNNISRNGFSRNDNITHRSNKQRNRMSLAPNYTAMQYSSLSKIPLSTASCNNLNAIINDENQNRNQNQSKAKINPNIMMSNTKKTIEINNSNLSRLSINQSKIPRSSSVRDIPSKSLKFNYIVQNKPSINTNNIRDRQVNTDVNKSRLSRSSSIRLSLSSYNKPKHSKIDSIDELMKLLSRNPNTCEKYQKNTPDFNELAEYHMKSPYKFQDLSTKNPTLFSNLSMYERIMQFPNNIYFTGISKTIKIKADLKNTKNNYGFDDYKNKYKIIIGDHINYKYEIESILGNGAFGSVISVINHSFEDQNRKVLMACKIIINNPKYLLQSIEEIKIMKNLRHENIVKYYEHFNFRSHICIITELAGISLYEAIKVNEFKGFSINLVKTIMKNILKGVSYLHSQNIIHCDLKPENIMINNKGIIKIIDFGSSCYNGKTKYTYLQSRFYRSPEVLMGCKYNQKIDIWSIGLISIELLIGKPIFQPETEFELFILLIQYLNIPSRKYILNSRHEFIIEDDNNTINYNTLLWKAFDKNGGINQEYLKRKTNRTSNIITGNKSIKEYIRKSVRNEYDVDISKFEELINATLVWNRDRRPDADEMLKFEFFN